MSTVDDLVRQGKVRYVGLSDTPAWAVARMATPGRARWSDLNVPLPFLRDLGVPAQQGATTVNGVRA